MTADEKIQVIRDYARNSGIKTFVETGSCDGYTVQGLLDDFDALYTIEIHPPFYRLCIQRFAGNGKVLPIQGDSAEMLGPLLHKLNRPVLAWLDAHYDGGDRPRGPVDTPIVQELETIIGLGANNVILIDDADKFGTDPAYPTVEWLAQFLEQKSLAGLPRYQLENKDGIIRLTV